MDNHSTIQMPSTVGRFMAPRSVSRLSMATTSASTTATASASAAPSSVNPSLPASLQTLSAAQAAAQAAANPTGTDTSGALQQSDFLTLMTAQLQNQDPTAPMDNTQFLGQMAQFSEVTSLGNMTTSLNNMASALATNQMVSSGSLIGRSVLSSKNTGTLATGSTVSGAVTLASAADGVTINITDSTGTVVDTMTMGAEAAGTYPFSWDGLESDGVTTAPAGQYTFSASVSSGGKTTAGTLGIYTQIASVSQPASGSTTSGITLNLIDGTSVPMSSVNNIQ
jgi:flagellar basal-body rod modification protein FlgD